MSAAWTGVAPELIRLWVNLGCFASALTLEEYISDHRALASLKSSDFEPYHVIALPPGSPAVIAGKTLEPRPAESTRCGLPQVLPCVVELIMKRCVGVVLPMRSEKRM